jgi:hypothetical protein
MKQIHDKWQLRSAVLCGDERGFDSIGRVNVAGARCIAALFGIARGLEAQQHMITRQTVCSSSTTLDMTFLSGNPIQPVTSPVRMEI